MMLSPLFALMLAAPLPAVTIYVGPVVKDGFVETDKGLQESIKDLRNELRKVKAVRVVGLESDASLRLYVLKRGIDAQSGGVVAGVAPGLGVLLGGNVHTPCCVSATTKRLSSETTRARMCGTPAWR